MVDIARLQIEVDSTQVLNAQNRLDSFVATSRKLGRNLSTWLTLPIMGMGVMALRTAGSYEESMNRVGAISQATGRELENLSTLARELGSTTRFSASEAADGMSFLAMAGFEVNEIMGAMPTTLRLAAAAKLDLARSADIVSNVMSGFRMDAEELEHAVDVLAAAFTRSNTDLEQLGNAMKMVGPVAAAFGIQFEEVTTAVGFLSDAGLQASMAGTGLRRVITTLVNESDKLGISVYNANGQIRTLAELLGDVEKQGFSSAEIMQIFGDRGGPAMQVLLGRSSDALREMSDELEHMGGTAQRIAEQQMEGLNGALLEMRSAFEELQIAISASGILDIATDLTRRITELLRSASELDPAILKLITVFAGFLAFLGPTILGLSLAASGMRNVIGMAQTLTRAMAALNAMMLLNPFALKAAAIGLVVGGLALAIQRINRTSIETREMERAARDLNETLATTNMRIQDITSSMQDMSVQQQRATVAMALKQVTEEIRQMEDQLAGEIEKIERLFPQASAEGLTRQIEAQLGAQMRQLEASEKTRRELHEQHTAYSLLLNTQKEIADIQRTEQMRLGRTPDFIRERLDNLIEEERQLKISLGIIQDQNDALEDTVEHVKNLAIPMRPQIAQALEEEMSRVQVILDDGSRKFLDAVKHWNNIYESELDLRVPGINPEEFFPPGSIGYVQEAIDQLEKEITATTDAKARKRMQIRRDEYQEMLDEMRGATDQMNRAAQDLGMTFASAFEDAIVGGQAFSQILQGLYQDILRLTTRMLVTEPFAQWFTQLVGSAGRPNLFGGFDTGGAQATQVADALITNSGQVIRFDSEDQLLAMQDFRPLMDKAGSGDGHMEVNVQVINNTPAEVEITEQRRGNGQVNLVAVIKQANRELFESGQMDKTMRNSFGVQRKPVRRG